MRCVKLMQLAFCFSFSSRLKQLTLDSASSRPLFSDVTLTLDHVRTQKLCPKLIPLIDYAMYQ